MLFRFLFSIFAILMLPVASIFLSAKLRTRLGKRRVVLSLTTIFVLIPVILALITPELIKSPYIRFMDRDQKYYAQIAHACDLVLQQHPLGTNATRLPIVSSDTQYVSVRISGNDPSVPQIIDDLHPSELTISSNCVYIMVGVRDFGISWEPQNGDTNIWALHVYPEGPGNVVYTETK